MRNILRKNIRTQAGVLAFSLGTGSPLAAAPVADFRVERKAVDRSLSWNPGIARGQSLFGTFGHGDAGKTAEEPALSRSRGRLRIAVRHVGRLPIPGKNVATRGCRFP